MNKYPSWYDNMTPKQVRCKVTGDLFFVLGLSTFVTIPSIWRSLFNLILRPKEQPQETWVALLNLRTGVHTTVSLDRLNTWYEDVAKTGGEFEDD